MFIMGGIKELKDNEYKRKLRYLRITKPRFTGLKCGV